MQKRQKKKVKVRSIKTESWEERVPSTKDKSKRNARGKEETCAFQFPILTFARIQPAASHCGCHDEIYHLFSVIKLS